MKGYHTSMPQSRTIGSIMPANYFDDSFKLISEAGMNHVRFVFYWESYERDPTNFMLELQSVAEAADKYNVNVMYDNHQFHTSSWFNPQRGNGIPLPFSFKTIHPILLEMAVDPNMHPQKPGGRLGGIDL